MQRERLEHVLQEMERRLASLETKLECVMSALDDLKAEVAAVAAIEASAVLLINGIADQLAAAIAANDPAALVDLTAQLKAAAEPLAAAVAAHTPPVV